MYKYSASTGALMIMVGIFTILLEVYKLHPSFSPKLNDDLEEAARHIDEYFAELRHFFTNLAFYQALSGIALFFTGFVVKEKCLTTLHSIFAMATVVFVYAAHFTKLTSNPTLFDDSYTSIREFNTIVRNADQLRTNIYLCLTAATVPAIVAAVLVISNLCTKSDKPDYEELTPKETTPV